MSKRSFPYQVKRHGSIVMIYEQKSKAGYLSYQLRYHRGSEVVRLTKSNLDDAVTEAESIALNLAQGELDVLALRSDDRLSYVRAIEALKDVGISLEHAAKQFAEAHRLLNGGQLLDAVKFCVKHQNPQSPAKNVAEVVSELVQHKRDKGRSDQYVNDLRLRLQKFAKSFHCPISSVTTSGIEEFLLSLKVSGRTQNNFRRLIGTLFHYATKRGYLPKDHRGVNDVELATEKPQEIQIFTPEEVNKLLTAAKPEIVPFVALGAFAGIRHAELKRLTWQDINLVEGHIQVCADAAKTRIRRLIPISQNLRAWLVPGASEDPIVSFANMNKQLLWLAEDAEVKWKRNGLRHSFVSYRTAQTQNIAQVSYEAGNSPRIIERNYLKRVTPTEAERWFSVKPCQITNIICLQPDVKTGSVESCSTVMCKPQPISKM